MATIKGKWRFNETLTTFTTGNKVIVNVNYTTETYYNSETPDIETGWYTISGTNFIFYNGVNHYYYRKGDIFLTSKNMITDSGNIYNTEYGWYCFDYEFGRPSDNWDISEEEISKRIRIFDFGETEQTVSDEFYNWLVSNAKQIEVLNGTTKISGKWLLKNDIIADEGFEITENVLFYSNSKYYSSMTIYEFSDNNIFVNYIKYDDELVYNEETLNYSPYGVWQNEEYKTIDFGIVKQKVSKVFYDWLVSNATFIGEIIIPSKSIYEVRSEKVRTNIIDKINISAKDIIPKEEKDAKKIVELSTIIEEQNGKSSIDEFLHPLNNASAPYEFNVVYRSRAHYYSRGQVTIKISEKNNFFSTYLQQNIPIENLSVSCQKKVSPSTKLNASIRSDDTTESSLSIDFNSMQVNFTEYSESNTDELLNLTKPTGGIALEQIPNNSSFYLEYNNEQSAYILTYTSIVAASYLEVKHNKYPFNFSDFVDGVYSFEMEGTYTVIEPFSATLSINGTMYTIDLIDKTISVGEQNVQNEFTIEGSELTQSNTYDSLGVPLLQKQYENTLNSYKNGKETAVIKCSVVDYKNANDVVVVSLTKKGLPMTIQEGSKVIPYIRNSTVEYKYDESTGKIIETYQYLDTPLSTYSNGEPKVFEVLGAYKYTSGTIWQELHLQEV